jgi:hypothetical protein
MQNPHPTSRSCAPVALAFVGESLLVEMARGVEESFLPGDTIVREGDPADRFYIIESGQVEGTQSPQTWELKYSFWFSHWLGQTNYAARLSYKIEGTNGLVEVEIRTTNYANDSECNVIGDTSFSCQAEELNVTFR